MSILVGILFVIFAIVAGFVGFVQAEENNTVPSVIAWVLCLAFVIGFICVPFSMHTVDAGEVAVVKEYGKTKEVKGAGLYFDFWVGKSYVYVDTKTQDLTIEAMTYSSDAQVMNVVLTVQYRFLGEKAMDVINEYGTTKALTSRITSVLTETPKAALSTRTAMEIIANRSAITPEILEAAKMAIGDKYPIEITNVAISNIDFSDAFEQAVEEKMIAEQNKLKADYENEKKVATAKANSEAKKIEAEGEAEANRLLENSLTENVLRDKYLDKWDGKLPSTMVGDDTALMVSP